MLTFTHTHYYLAADEDEEEEEEEEEEGTGPPTGLKEGRNSQLTVGYKGDRSYVVRGDKIGVFRHKADEVEYVASIANITDMKGKKFDPKNVSLLSIAHLPRVKNPWTGHVTSTRLQDGRDEPGCTELPIPPRLGTCKDR